MVGILTNICKIINEIHLFIITFHISHFKIKMRKRPMIFNHPKVLYGIKMICMKYNIIVIIVLYILVNLSMIIDAYCKSID